MKKQRAAAPTWGTESVLIQVKGSGMAPLKATKLHVVMPDGSIASKKQLETIAVWPSARLRLIFGQSVNWYGKNEGAWHDSAVRLVMKLAPLVSPKWIVQDIIGRNDIPVLAAKAYTVADAKKIASRALFDYRKDNAWACLRSGGPRDVQWDACVIVAQDAVQVHLPDTSANVKKLAAVLDRIVRDVPFAWAGVGRGTNGFPNVLALAGNEVKRARIAGASQLALGQTNPKNGADSLVWIGRAWGSEDGGGGDLERVTGTPKKLATRLAKMISDAHTQARREILRKR